MADTGQFQRWGLSMRVKSVLAAGAGLVICALAAGASAQRGEVLGEWRAQQEREAEEL